MNKALYKIKNIYYKLFRPITIGIRILLIKNNKITLIKHTYIKGWYLPGGGVKKNETIDQAIKREIHEEVSGSIKTLKVFGVYSNLYENKNDHIIVFLSSSFNIGKPDLREVAEIKQFQLNNLPKNTSPGSLRRVKEYQKEKNKIHFGKW